MPSRCRAVLALLVLLPLAIQVPAGARSVRSGIDGIDDSDRVVLPGAVHPLARPEAAVGRTDPRLAMERIVLSLALRPGARTRLETLLADQQDPASPRYHRWLTPVRFGAEFGLGDRDLKLVVDWLEAQGFGVGAVAAGRGWIELSGTAGQVERAFATEMRDYRIDGVIRHANAVVPSIPRALSGLVQGIVSLHDIPALPLLARQRPGALPARALARHGILPRDNGPGGTHLLAPADLATIYNLRPLFAAGIDGSGQSIAIAAETDINLADVQAFRSTFGLPPNDPVFVHNGPDPGITFVFEEGESDLDVEWAGAAAPRATVLLVISKSTSATLGIVLSTQYIVDHDLAPVMSLSYGLCEHFFVDGMSFWGGLQAQAAAQGISSFVGSGDSGAAGCSAPDAHGGGGFAAVNGFCSTPHDVCVGGTELDDTGNPAAYWSATNDPVTQGSALSYIPEVAWNESGDVAGGAGLFASGGGASAFFGKPAWQSAPGVPADGARDVPDVALAAARHTAYLYLEEQQLMAFGGTSFATPAFAGIMALVVQKTGQRQGNPNPWLYRLAARQLTGQGPAVFHDVTSGNNSVPGVTGFAAGPGYDQATGLGSVDGAALVNGWPAAPAPSSCAPSLCIDDQPGDGRFVVSVSFTTGGPPAAATAIPLASLGIAQSGLFWFFAPSKPELLLKVLDGCQVNQKFWVFYAAGTNVGFTVTVTDHKAGRSKQYTNRQSVAAPPVQDTAAFDCE
jgi:subtilase family serine protease